MNGCTKTTVLSHTSSGPDNRQLRKLQGHCSACRASFREAEHDRKWPHSHITHTQGNRLPPAQVLPQPHNGGTPRSPAHLYQQHPLKATWLPHRSCTRHTIMYAATYKHQQISVSPRCTYVHTNAQYAGVWGLQVTGTCAKMKCPRQHLHTHVRTYEHSKGAGVGV